MSLFKIDFVSAYLNTPMPVEVIHKWVLLNKMVSAELVKRDPEKWSRFLRPDGRILVEMLKLAYGYREAAHYWGVALHDMMQKAGFSVAKKDERVYTKREGVHVLHTGVIVDDCCGASTSIDMVKSFVTLCEETFKECT